MMLSTANLRLGDYSGAEEVGRKLLAVDPNSIAAMQALTTSFVARREYRKVVDLLTPFAKDVDARGKGRESDAALLLLQLAHAHLELKEHDQAIGILTTAVTRDPKSAPALNSLGYTLAERGQRLTEAVGFIERALKVDPDNPSYLDSLGWALFKQGKGIEAETQLRKAAEALPEQSVIQDHFGDVLAKNGKVPEAIGASDGMRKAGRSRQTVLRLWLAVAVILTLCTVAGYGIADAASNELLGGINGFAAGALIVMLVDSMVPEATRQAGRTTGLVTTLGFALATGLSGVT